MVTNGLLIAAIFGNRITSPLFAHTLVAFIISSVFLTPEVNANLNDFQSEYASELERRAAIANQAAYDRLQESGCTDTQRSATEECTAETFKTWATVRELVHTANELNGSGPTLFSLGLDLEGLGFSLRWTAGEEFAAQGDMSDSFVSGQMAGLATRITALRGGGSQFSMNVNGSSSAVVARTGGIKGGGAGDTIPAWSPWGFFLNADYSYGDRAATQREDAFDFDGASLNGGIDYRYNNNWVAGIMLGYQAETLDFDSTQSIVDGTVDMSGVSLQPFALYQSDQFYFSLALGYQHMSFDTERSIRYPSLNPGVDSTDTTAVSNTNANAISGNLDLGYTLFPRSRFSLEPYIGFSYTNTSIDGYSETDLRDDGFAFLVAAQKFDSLESAIGVKLNYIFTPSIGVILPYFSAELRNQLDAQSREIKAVYLNSADLLNQDNIDSDATFALPTDTPDSAYGVISLGVSSVLRGARQTAMNSSAAGGIQVFVQFRTLLGLEHYKQSQLAAGLRYEF
ncbi:autotransporter outer membrane beta-barrel domain-containing protein [Teredinibacter waterburyi]|uniref:autotransporter outer membrane beta-barrel domain-containing protein n=1 Tax=Teredinibacter waterburyi TaxID=1500538 RepID=UPI00165EE50C|nr:autotransporter outer membrane beta-barrel domain-containing protein [Teredinibacter waterburyi]